MEYILLLERAEYPGGLVGRFSRGQGREPEPYTGQHDDESRDEHGNDAVWSWVHPDDILYEKLDGDSVDVWIYLRLENSTNLKLEPQEKGIQLFDRFRKPLDFVEIEPNHALDGMALPPKAKGSYRIHFRTKPGAKTDYASLSGYVLRFAMRSGKTIVKGRVEIFEDWQDPARDDF